jgi:hypothetical protein
MLGSLDVMQIPWANCPQAQRGQHVGKGSIPTLGLEAVADNARWFWHHDFGHPGSLNDINIWEKSELAQSMVDGTHAKLDFKFKLNDEFFAMLYYLVDGIYPELARFVKTIPVPVTDMEKFFVLWQEAKRKDIECAFGILQKKFNFLCIPVKSFFVDDIYYIVKACIALHNMMVKFRLNLDEQESGDFYDVVESQDDADEPASVDEAIEAINREDEYFAQNQDKLDLNGEVVDVELLEKYKRAQLLGNKTRIVEKCWRNLTDTKTHHELRNAIIHDIHRNKRDHDH